MPTPEGQRRFAAEVVGRLREAGFEAYWAGGCVRDQRLNRTPKDYDVATNATPDQVRQLFGRRRTLAIGAAFGVIAVLGPRTAGTVEVTTFRRDAAYSDGRHPDSVTFSSAEEDASRRDFTINGLFYDPIEDRVIDFVGGQQDLADRRLRAIGDAGQRFAEDKLRMLRAVRFAATYQLTVDDEVRRAIGRMAGDIRAVSPERIAMEMRRLLVDAHRADGIRLLLETGLTEPLLPEVIPHDPPSSERLEASLAALARLPDPCGFPLALAVMLHSAVDSTGAMAVCRRWRLSNKETDRVVWLVEHGDALREASTMRWSSLQPLLIDEGAADLLAWAEARGWSDVVAWCHMQIEQRRGQMDPAPLVTGDDLLAEGIPPGPQFKGWLQRARDAQLDDEIHSKEDALRRIQQWRAGEA
ncbi:MAG: CCA tRNA nucleotidyltransferase [Thermoguttaceae bacterium]